MPYDGMSLSHDPTTMDSCEDDGDTQMSSGHTYGDISAHDSASIQLGDQYIRQQFVTVNLGGDKQSLKRKRSDASVNDRISDAFAFRELHDRAELIQDPLAGTFRWTTQGLSEEQERQYWRYKTRGDPLGLLKWLESGTGVFRIIGKAGCGKSTLMKFLLAEQACIQSLRIWAKPSNLLAVSFFAWRPGTVMQKTLNGLKRSILHEALKQDPELIDIILKSQDYRTVSLKALRADSNLFIEWSDAEINHFWTKLTRAQDRKICIFLDGLDELSHTMLEVGRFVESLLTHSEGNIKMVIAGRDEPLFDQLVPSQQLYLHNLVRSDIERFVAAELTAREVVQRRFATCPHELDKLVKTIVNKASGVFVWVRPAIDTLLEGIIEDDTIEDLLCRTDEIPDDIIRLYRSILLRMPQKALAEASEYLSLLHRVQTQWTTRHYQTLHLTLALAYDATDTTWIVEQSKQDLAGLELIANRATSRILLRCSHFVCFSDSGDIMDNRIDYVHRTAYDFLASGEAAAIFEASALEHRNLDPAVSLAHVVLYMILDHANYSNRLSNAIVFLAAFIDLREFILLDGSTIDHERPMPALKMMDKGSTTQVSECMRRWVIDVTPVPERMIVSDYAKPLDSRVSLLRDRLQADVDNKEYACLCLFALIGFNVQSGHEFQRYSNVQVANLFSLEMLGVLYSDTTGHVSVSQRLQRTSPFMKNDAELIGMFWFTLLHYIQIVLSHVRKSEDPLKLGHGRLVAWAYRLLQQLKELLVHAMSIDPVLVYGTLQQNYTYLSLRLILGELRSVRHMADDLWPAEYRKFSYDLLSDCEECLKLIDEMSPKNWLLLEIETRRISDLLVVPIPLLAIDDMNGYLLDAPFMFF